MCRPTRRKKGAARRILTAPCIKLALAVPQSIGMVERTFEAGQEQILGVGISAYPPGVIKHSTMYENRKAISTRITKSIRRISPTSCRVRQKLVFCNSSLGIFVNMVCRFMDSLCANNGACSYADKDTTGFVGVVSRPTRRIQKVLPKLFLQHLYGKLPWMSPIKNVKYTNTRSWARTDSSVKFNDEKLLR